MNKWEIKCMLEQQQTNVDKLTDTTDKQSLHIQNLWEEISSKNYRINNLEEQISLKDEEIKKFRSLIRTQSQKNLQEYVYPESVNN